jgi:plasmid stabilization system protein ParE
MKYPVIFRPEAETDLCDAYRWYEERKTGLGKDFLLEIDACISSIQRHPHPYPVKHKAIRRALIRRFPYGIFYLIEENAIVIFAVFHAKRDPRVWQSRV